MKDTQLNNAISEVRIKNQHRKTIAFWTFIVLVLMICTVLVTSSFVGHSSYEKGIHYEHIRMIAQNKNHPQVQIKYKKGHLYKKKVPMVHIENATDKQVDQAIKKTHKDDFNAFKKYLHKYSNNDNKNSNNNSSSKSSNNKKGQVTLQQALKAESQADHSNNSKD